MYVYRFALRFPEGEPLKSPIHFGDLRSIPENENPKKFGKNLFNDWKPDRLPPEDAIYLTLPDSYGSDPLTLLVDYLYNMHRDGETFDKIPSYNEIRVETFLNNQIEEQQAKLLFSEEGLNIIIASDEAALANFLERFNFPSRKNIGGFNVCYRTNQGQQLIKDHKCLERILKKSPYPMSNEPNENQFLLSIEQYNWLKALTPTQTKDNKQSVFQNLNIFWSSDQSLDEKGRLGNDLQPLVSSSDSNSDSNCCCIIS